MDHITVLFLLYLNVLIQDLAAIRNKSMLTVGGMTKEERPLTVARAVTMSAFSWGLV